MVLVLYKMLCCSYDTIDTICRYASNGCDNNIRAECEYWKQLEVKPSFCQRKAMWCLCLSIYLFLLWVSLSLFLTHLLWNGSDTCIRSHIRNVYRRQTLQQIRLPLRQQATKWEKESCIHFGVSSFNISCLRALSLVNAYIHIVRNIFFQVHLTFFCSSQLVQSLIHFSFLKRKLALWF